MPSPSELSFRHCHPDAPYSLVSKNCIENVGLRLFDQAKSDDASRQPRLLPRSRLTNSGPEDSKARSIARPAVPFQLQDAKYCALTFVMTVTCDDFPLGSSRCRSDLRHAPPLYSHVHTTYFTLAPEFTAPGRFMRFTAVCCCRSFAKFAVPSMRGILDK